MLPQRRAAVFGPDSRLFRNDSSIFKLTELRDYFGANEYESDLNTKSVNVNASELTFAEIHSALRGKLPRRSRVSFMLAGVCG